MSEFSQNGWPVFTSSDSLVKTLAGQRMPNGVVPGDVATVLGYVAQQFHNRVEPLVDGWCWGWNNRAVTGGTVKSNHASATAIDLNAPRHPYGKANTFTPVQRSAIREILTEVSPAVRWGGDYTGNRDDMHFEINAGVGVVAAVAARIRNAQPKPQPPTEEEEEPMILKAGTNLTLTVPTLGKGTLDIFVSMGSHVTLHQMFGVGASPSTPPPGGDITFRKPVDQVIDSDRGGPISIPNAGATRGVVLVYSCDRDFTVVAS